MFESREIQQRSMSQETVTIPLDEVTEEELEDWDSLNKLLQHHGFKPISVADPKDKRPVGGMVLLTKQSAGQIRHALKSLMKDTERRQALIQELIQTNNQLKDDIRQQYGRASRQEQRTSELEQVLDNVKTKIQEMEDDFIKKTCQQQNHVKQLQKDKRDIQVYYTELEQKLRVQEEIISQLQKKLRTIIAEEEERVTRQNNIFHQFRKRVPKANSTLDQQLLDMISTYESQIDYLQRALRTYKENAEPQSMNNEDKELNLDTSPNYKALLKSYQEQLKEARTRNEQLLLENINIKQELETRPSMKELKLCKQQAKRLERLLLHNGVKLSEFPNGRQAEEKENTKVEDLDSIHADVCRHVLKDACGILKVHDLNDLLSTIRLMAKQLEAIPTLEKVLNDISSVVSNQRAPQMLFRRSTSSHQFSVRTVESKYEHLVPTLEMWINQLMALKDLFKSLRKLLAKVIPWQIPDLKDQSEGTRVEDLQMLIDTVLEEVEYDKENRRASPETMRAIVSHFQTLFDVSSLNGVYPRMNEVYIKLEEMNNAMRNLRVLLGLDPSVPCSTLVNAVGNLCSSLSDDTTKQIQLLLGTQDLNSIIIKLKDYDEFFPAFSELLNGLFQILDVNSVDDILVEVQSLKLKTKV
ncbi:centrosomal protein of 70 kDa isoform X2 [Protopterus annectens]|uniref:centrosomal protein of 70 kDa isoform X2 n=1 Tax=Protopterus annectens TaxID=7888 RepID=UPI001CFB63EF|nr:centrosomal protein of 70 kDa isoform X2 [Protopterus annectens]